MNKLALLFHSEVRAEVLRVLFGLRTEKMYRAEIIEQTDYAQRSVEEELQKLVALELLTTTKERHRRYYLANTAHPLYPELRSIVLKTSGLRDVLAAALSDPGIEFAFVFGSIAAQADKSASDVDLMVVGDVTEFRLAKLLRGMGDRLGREVNPHVFTRKEITRRVDANDHFLNDVLAKPKLFLTGNEHDFAQLAQRRVDSTA